MDKKLKKSSLCKWSKADILDNLEDLIVLVGQPNYVCRKCTRVANDKINLCKPIRFRRENSG
jgi:hypothetical protein